MILHNSSEIRKSAPMALASPGLPTRPRLNSPQSSQYIYTVHSAVPPHLPTHTHIKMIIKKHKNHPIQTFYTCEVVRTRTLCLTQTAVEKHRTHLLPLNVDLDQSTNKPNNDVRNKLHRDHIHMIRKHEQKQFKKSTNEGKAFGSMPKMRGKSGLYCHLQARSASCRSLE